MAEQDSRPLPSRSGRAPPQDLEVVLLAVLVPGVREHQGQDPFWNMAMLQVVIVRRLRAMPGVNQCGFQMGRKSRARAKVKVKENQSPSPRENSVQEQGKVVLARRWEDHYPIWQVLRCTDFEVTSHISLPKTQIQRCSQPCPYQWNWGPRLRFATYSKRWQVHPYCKANLSAAFEVRFAAFAPKVAFESLFPECQFRLFETFEM